MNKNHRAFVFLARHHVYVITDIKVAGTLLLMCRRFFKHQYHACIVTWHSSSAFCVFYNMTDGITGVTITVTCLRSFSLYNHVKGQVKETTAIHCT